MKIKKLKNQKGETIAEVLIASLVAVLGVILFATMVVTSYHIISESDRKMKEFYLSESEINAMTRKVGGSNASFELLPKYSGGFSVDGSISFPVTVYGSESIKAYKKN